MITLGLDVGSLFTKAVLLNDERIHGTLLRETSGAAAREIEELIDRILVESGVARKDLEIITSTGQGDELVEQADFCEDDVACIAAATRRLLPDTELTIEIGGQSITGVLSDSHGEVVNFMRNDKCASGSGRFIEVISAALGLNIDQFDQTVGQAVNKIKVSTQCAVFAESEIISYANQGEPVADIIAGVCESTARIVISQALRFGPVKNYTVTGGVANFSSIIKVLQERLPGQYRTFPINPQFSAAYGAALLGQEELA